MHGIQRAEYGLPSANPDPTKYQITCDPGLYDITEAEILIVPLNHNEGELLIPGPGSCLPTPDFCQGRFLRGTHVGSGLSLVPLSLK